MRIRSTQQYVETPFHPGGGTREARLDRINQGLKYDIVPPLEYRDAYGKQIMDTPCDIRVRTIIRKEFISEPQPDGSLKEEWITALDETGKPVETTFLSPPCYVDVNAKYRYDHHPSSNLDIQWKENWTNGTYVANQALSREIEAWLTIEEIKKYVKDLEKARDDTLKAEMPEIRGPKREKVFRLFSTSSKVLQNTGRCDEVIPQEFISAFSGRLMTLPVRLNGKDIIDFKELFMTEDETLNDASFESIMDGYRAYCKEDLSNLQNSYEKDLSNLDALSEDSLNLEEKTRIIEEVRARFREDYNRRFTLVGNNTVKSISLEQYAEHFNIPELLKILPKYKKYYDHQYSIPSGEMQRALRRIENAKEELIENLANLIHITKKTKQQDEIESVESKARSITANITYLESKLIDEDDGDDEATKSAKQRRLLDEKSEFMTTKLGTEIQKINETGGAIQEEATNTNQEIRSLKENIEEISERISQELIKVIDLKSVIKSFVKKTTFEWWIKFVYIADSRTYVNPCDNEPITSIEVEQSLLKRLDDWLDPLKEQIRTVEKHVAEYSTFTELGFKANYAEIMRPHLEKDTIPNICKFQHLTPSLIPGTREVEFATHPVLLDGAYVIDYGRLKEYWGSKGVIGWVISWVYEMNWFGYNPFTGRLCQTIEYMHPLKQETDQYMKTVWCAKFFKPENKLGSKLLLSEQADTFHSKGNNTLRLKY